MKSIVSATISRAAIAAATLVTALMIAGCGRSDRDDNLSSSAPAAEGTRQPAAMAGSTVTIHTIDGAVVLGMTTDTVYMGLSDSVLAAVRDSMALDTSDSRGLGGVVSRYVKRNVNSALQMRVKYPVQDIESAKYEDGKIQFAYRQRRRISFEDVKTNNEKTLSAFTPDDARKFVNALNANIAAHKTTR